MSVFGKKPQPEPEKIVLEPVLRESAIEVERRAAVSVGMWKIVVERVGSGRTWVISKENSGYGNRLYNISDSEMDALVRVLIEQRCKLLKSVE